MEFVTIGQEGAIIEGDFHRVENQARVDPHTLAGLASSLGMNNALKIAELIENIRSKFTEQGISLKESGHKYGDTVSCNIGGKSPDEQHVAFNLV